MTKKVLRLGLRVKFAGADSINEKVGALAEKFGTMQIRMMIWSLGTTIAVATLAFTIAKFVK